jgi:carbon storage regulator
MLVLSRKKEEQIVIGNGIVVKVIEICGNRVKLGLTAPPSVPIARGEIYTAEKKEKKEKNGVERQTS